MPDVRQPSRRRVLRPGESRPPVPAVEQPAAPAPAGRAQAPRRPLTPDLTAPARHRRPPATEATTTRPFVPLRPATAPRGPARRPETPLRAYVPPPPRGTPPVPSPVTRSMLHAPERAGGRRRASRSSRLRQLAALPGRHRAFTVVLGLGALLRLLAWVAYMPAIEFFGDSYAYLKGTQVHYPGSDRPYGYSAFLLVLSPTGSLAVVTAVQHLLGLGAGIALYAFLRHRQVRPWLAVAATVPILLDAYQVDIEQFVMAETLFDVVLIGAVVTLLWHRTPTARACVIGGVLLALAVLTRTAAAGIVVLAFCWLLTRQVGRRRVGLFVVATAIPLLAYAGWYAAWYGTFSLQSSSGRFLYARVAQFADCSQIAVTPDESYLCSPHPPSERPGPNFYLWNHSSPRFHFPPGVNSDATVGDFAHKIIAAQPLDYLNVVLSETAHYFTPGRYVGFRDWPMASWQFPNDHEQRGTGLDRGLRGYHNEEISKSWNQDLGAVLRGYQRQAFTPGPLLASLLLVAAGVALLGGLGGRAARWENGVRVGRWRVGLDADRRVRADCALLGVAALSLLVVPSATACFDYRYLLPTLVLLPPAAALGLDRMWAARSARSRSGSGRSSSERSASHRSR